MGDGVVEAALVVDVQGGSDKVHERRPELAERADGTLTVLDGPGVAAGDGDGRPEVQFLADDWQRRDRAEPNDVAELVWRVGDEFAVEAQHVGGVLGRPEHRSGHDGGADGVQREPERADDAEVPAAAPQRPEQVGVIVGRCPNDVALGGDHLGLHEVVDGEPVLAHEPADAAAQAEATDAGVAHDAARRGKTVCLCLVVDVAPQGAALDEGRALDGIDRRRARIAERSITMPSSQTAVPATLWPPPRTAISRSRSRANRTAAATSAVPLQRAISRGRRSTVPFHTARASSYPSWSEVITSPRNPGICIVGWRGHRSSSGRWAHRNIGRYRREGSYLDLEVRNLDFTAVEWRGTLCS